MVVAVLGCLLLICCFIVLMTFFELCCGYYFAFLLLVDCFGLVVGVNCVGVVLHGRLCGYLWLCLYVDCCVWWFVWVYYLIRVGFSCYVCFYCSRFSAGCSCIVDLICVDLDDGCVYVFAFFAFVCWLCVWMLLSFSLLLGLLYISCWVCLLLF